MTLASVQQALYSKLTGDGVLMGMVSGVFDAVPERTALPYVILGDGTETKEDSLGSSTSRCVLPLHVWTDAAGRKTALTIMDRIYGLLHQGVISPVGFELVLMRCQESSTELAEVGSHMHGVVTFEIVVR